MNRKLKKFGIFTFIISLFILVCNSFFGETVVNPYVWHILIFICAMMFGTYFLTFRGMQKDVYDAQNYFLISTAIRLFLSGFTLFLYIYFIRIHRFTFVLNFFILYFLYTFFEIKTLLLSLQPNNKGNNL
ncbi:MAG: hypothetical protein NW207_05430 [Cytophagales bacterium]|nr:hypothetical protein [Cytophagales bacterium]